MRTVEQEVGDNEIIVLVISKTGGGKTTVAQLVETVLLDQKIKVENKDPDGDSMLRELYRKLVALRERNVKVVIKTAQIDRQGTITLPMTLDHK